MAKQYPKQDKTIYVFAFDANSNILRNNYDHYRIDSAYRNLSTQNVIWIKTPNGIVRKYDDQLDRVLNNHIYTYDPDIDRAKEMFLNSIVDKIREHQHQIEILKRTQDKLLCHILTEE